MTTGPETTLALRAVEPAGAPAHGLIAPVSALLRRAAMLERSAPARGGLMLRLSGALAVLWSVTPPALPWFSEPVVYLGPPDQRVFTPIGARLEAPPILAAAWRAALAAEHGIGPPLLLAPARVLGGEGDGTTVLDLRESAPLDAVDWARLAARGPKA